MVLSRTIRYLVFLPAPLLLLLCSCSEPETSFTCTDTIGCITVGPEEPVQIGVLQALTGEVAPLGQAQLRGLQLALDKRNNSLLGHPVTQQIEDTGCTREGGANATLKLIANPQTVAIFGSTCSGAAAPASKAMSAAGLTMISGNNSAPNLTSLAGHAAPGWQAGYFRTAPNEENAGRAAAGYVFHTLGLYRAASIHDNDIYTRGLTESFKKAFTELGGAMVLETAVNKGEQEMQPVLTAIINSGAEVVFFPLFQPEGNHILRQAKAMSAFDKILLIGGGALIEQTFLDEVDDLGEGMCFVGPSKPKGTAVDQLAAAYVAKFKEKPTVDYYLSGYDAADLLFYALEKTGVQEQDGSVHFGRMALRKTLYAVTGFKGVTGSLSCDQFGDCAQSSFDVLCLEDCLLGLEGLQENRVYSSGTGKQP